jgi:HEAT repeat protein
MAEPLGERLCVQDDAEALCRAISEVAQLAQRDPDRAEAYVPSIVRALDASQLAVQSHAVWASGQIGAQRPYWLRDAMPTLARLSECDSEEIRARAVAALGRIGTTGPELVEPYLPAILLATRDEGPEVRRSAMVACRQLGSERPGWFTPYVELFIAMLHDPDDDIVRREAPQVLRAIGRLRPDLVTRAIPRLRDLSQDEREDPVVRIHSQAALKEIQALF